ncbi:hypothetical protein DPMN_192469 [Dreissena polymorpha]|uniref:Uncharacterized protein n=1 Tax=Dreissena polymorpha TaxID=45954 RepID=A0A9D4BEN7_DREPO|nr:hypothetical protein DPMN_192469 [Dreissena polymorpha]
MGHKASPETQRNYTILKKCQLIHDEYTKNVTSRFHLDSTKNVTSCVLTRKNASYPGGRVFQQTISSFELNLTIRVTSRVKCPPTGVHVFQRTVTIFKLRQDIIRTHFLTNKMKIPSPLSAIANKEKCPTPDRHVLQPTGTIFELVQYLIRTLHVTSIMLTRTELIQYIIRTFFLTKFHEDWTIIVTSRVLTWFYQSHIKKTATSPCSHVISQPDRFSITSKILFGTP